MNSDNPLHLIEVPPMEPVARAYDWDLPRFQACQFQKAACGVWESGLARLADGFSQYSIQFLVDLNGHRVGHYHDYRLFEGPLCYLEVPNANAPRRW